jgi:cytochrome c556
VTYLLNRLPGLAVMLALLAPAAGHTEHPADHLHLSPDLTRLLQQEMQAIQQGMQSLLPALVSGNWQVVTETATHIQHSYIMKQQLTAAHLQELQQLPPAFRDLDQSFHGAAGRLAQAAQQQDAQVAGFWFYRLTDGCIACHSRFAANRFPALTTPESAAEHPH